MRQKDWKSYNCWGAVRFYSTTTWLLIQRAIFVFSREGNLVGIQFCWSSQGVLPFACGFYKPEWITRESSTAKEWKAMVEIYGKCLDERYENIFHEGLSLRRVFEFGGRSHLLGIQTALKLRKERKRERMLIIRQCEVKDLRPNTRCFPSSEYCQNTLVVYFC